MTAKNLRDLGYQDIERGVDRRRTDNGSSRPTVKGRCHGCLRSFEVVCNGILKGQGPCRSCGNGRSQVKNMIRDRESGGLQWKATYTGYITDLGDDLVKIGIGDLNRAGRSGRVSLRVQGRRLDVLLWERSLLNLSANAAPTPSEQREAVRTQGGHTEVRRGVREILHEGRRMAILHHLVCEDPAQTP